MRVSQIYSLIFCLFVLFISCNLAEATALDDYVAVPDPNYRYVQIGGGVFDFSTFTTGYTLQLTSQVWRNPSEVDHVLWKHWVTVIVPFFGSQDTALLLIGQHLDPNAPPVISPEFRQLATGTGSVLVELSNVPNQPLQFSDEVTPRVEDEIIAYSWDKFIRGGDANWPVQLPMVKSVVRCMDAVQSFTSGTINSFALSGGSKRGWTAWLTAAVDSRVAAIAPIVSDLLNMKRSFAHHWGVYGFWAPALKPYQDMDIFDRFDMPETTELLEIVDPYEYRDRLDLPKFIINSAGDDFFVMDSIQFYIDGLIGETYLRHVPNTDHYLTDALEDVINSVVPYYYAFLNGHARPKFSWSLAEDGSIRVETIDIPIEVKLWQASNPSTRDFRKITIGTTWVSTPLTDEDGGIYVGQVPEPNGGWTAFFVELIFESTFLIPGDYDYHFTTEMRVLPETRLFEGDFNRDRMTNFSDVAILSNLWLSRDAYRDMFPRRSGDGIVNLKDFGLIAMHWMEEGPLEP